MRTHVSHRRPGHEGVTAIFTSPRKERDVRLVIGLAGVAVGVALWAVDALDVQSPRLFGVSIISSYLSLTLASLGLLFTICGAGICLAFSAVSESPLTDEVEKDDEVKTLASNAAAKRDSPLPSRSAGGMHGLGAFLLLTPNLRLGLVAFVQSCALLALYAGLVEEYQSNLTMQIWVRSNLPVANYALGGGAVILASGVLGLLVVQFLPRRILAQ